MVDSQHLTRLIEIAPPDLGADEQIEWETVERSLGTRLPSDYVAFMGTYGAGEFGEELGVDAPFPIPGPMGGQGVVSYWEEARRVYESDGRGANTKLDLDQCDVLVWGSTCGPDALCWLTTDPDPNRWPVLVWGRHTDFALARYDVGMAEFLTRLFLGQFDDWPLSVTWDGSLPFVHWRIKNERWLAGLNPYTGEPDPYADMFPR